MINGHLAAMTTKILTVAQRKGGAGKTTLACHLIAYFCTSGIDLGAIDADDQGSLSGWAQIRAQRRTGLEFDFDRASGYGLGSAIRRMSRQCDLILIDTPPTIDTTVSRAVEAADLVVAPLQLTPLDLDAAIPTAQLISKADRPALFVANRVPPRARIADLIRQKIRESALPIARTELGNRAAFAESLASGHGVTESEPGHAAAEEIESLGQELKKVLGLTTKKKPRAA